MDRLNQLRGGAGGSGDSTLDTSAAPSEAYLTANESSKYFSLTEDDSSFDITPIKDVSLASTVEPDKTITGNDQLISNLSPIAKKNDLLGGYKFGKQIEAANILSGGVDIFDDNDNSYDGDELVIDDNAETDEKSNSELKLIENTKLPFQKCDEIGESLDSEPAVESKDTEVVLMIDGKNVNAIDIGNGLYLYRKAGQEELAAVQIVADDNNQPSFKFLKVRENAEGNLEVYEEIEIEVPKEVPTKEEKSEKNPSHVPIKDVNKIITEPVCNKVAERIKPQQEIKPVASTSDTDESKKVLLAETKTEMNLNGKMKKYNETRKSPVIHSTPNKEGIPLTKTMVDMHLHPSRPLDKVKTIEVHTDSVKQKTNEIQMKNKDSSDNQQSDATICNKDIQRKTEIIQPVSENKEPDVIKSDVTGSIKEKKEKSESGTQSLGSSGDGETLNAEELKPVSTESKQEKPNKDKAVTTSLKVDTKSEVKDSNDPTDKPNSSERDKETDNKIIQKNDSKEITKNTSETVKTDVTGEINKDYPEVTKIDNTEEIKKDNTEEVKTEETKKGDTNVTKIKDSICKTGLPIISKNDSQINVNKHQESQECDKNKDDKMPQLIKPYICNKINSANEAEKDKNTASSTKPLDKLDDLKKEDLIQTPESNSLQILNDKKIIEKNFEKINNNITEQNVAVQKECKKENENKDIKNKEHVAVLTVSNEEVKSASSLASNKDKDTVNPEATVKEPHTQIKQTKLFTTIKPEAPISEDTTKPKSIQSNIEKSNQTNVKDNTHAVDTKQSFAHKPTESADDKTMPDKPLKEDPKQLIDITKPTCTERDIEPYQNKSEVKINKLPPTVPMAPQRKPEITKPINTIEKKPVISSTTEIKPNISRTSEKKPIINNNAAVPFGQWTSANRQEFLNKIKEAKIPVTVSNTKSISKPNDLNRRDVLQKIDSQRQSSNAANKNQDLSKSNVKNEVPTFTNKPAVTAAIQSSSMIRDVKAPLKIELLPVAKNKPVVLKKVEKPEAAQTSHRPQPNSTVTSTYMTKSEGTNRNEFNNQHLIDKTVEGIINRAVATKPQDSKPNVTKEPTRIPTTYQTSYKSKESKPSILDAIEMKMNELHGIPFVERPPHELPRVYNRDIKTYGKTDIKPANKVSNIPNLLPVTKAQKTDVKDDIIDLDSEEEVIEHEPITGDIDLSTKKITSKQSDTSAETTMAQVGSDSSKKESIITEKDFDKFVRRNSITYENCLTVNIETNKNRNVVQGLVQRDVTDKNIKNIILETNKSPTKHRTSLPNNPSHKINVTSKLVPVNEDAFNKNYQSKLQLAYQTALTTKRQMESPITILEDKPVKVVFMDSNTKFLSSQLNVQGPDLSPNKKSVVPKEPDSITISTGDSLDSDVLDSADLKAQDDVKLNKSKHQRKQVLTPVETPDLELIVPGDLGIEVSPKKKRKIDDFKVDKSPKSLVPKKSYLLGRNAESPSSLDSTKETSKHIEEMNIIVTHKDTASAIDNLVKAAELIENQAGNFKADVSTPDNTSPATPVKRGRGRPRKYPLPDSTPNNPKVPSPQKKPRLIDNKDKVRVSQSASEEDSSDESIGEGIVRENWTMGKINENIVCPICNKLFRSENVVFKHVKHCTGPSPNRSDSDKRSSRRSRLSNDSKSMDSKLDDTEGETDSIVSKKSTPKKMKSKGQSSESKEEVIVIEDTPVKSKVEKNNEPKQHESRKPTKTKAQYKVSSLSCEECGKTFRQLSYLVSHKLLHKKVIPKNTENVTQSSNKSVFSCEVCNKEFRKLHHLVQHRIIHNASSAPKLSRKSSSEQNIENKTSKDKDTKQPEDPSAAFRCEPCDKSFRKLHHLVEHRETHDGINRQKGTPAVQTIEKIIQNPPPPPQCEICKKTFRKLHHLIEHKEQHVEVDSEKSDDKSVKSALSTKDIIHECSLCYMVFPNEHSLNKHSVFCQRKKRQSTKISKQTDDEPVMTEHNEIVVENKETSSLEPAISKSTEVVEPAEPEEVTKINESVIVKEAEIPEIKDKPLSNQKDIPVELPVEPSKQDLQRASSPPVKAIEKPQEETPEKKQLEVKEDKTNVEPKTMSQKPNKKSPLKGASAPKRRRSNLPLARIKEAAGVESSDDDEVRYMLNPDYKYSSPKPDVVEPTSEGKLFMKVRAKKRNSLQFERPTSKDLVKRRTSLQHPPKIPRLKAKDTNDDQTISKPPQLEPVPCTDSDDSDVKYSFPVKEEKPLETVKSPKEKRKSVSENAPAPKEKRKSVTENALAPKEKRKSVTENAPTPKEKRKSVTENAPKPTEDVKTPKEKRKSLAEKRKMLSGIARRKSLGKPASAIHKEKPSPVTGIKKRRAEVEHRCDCGQLFSSAAMLARHTTLAHTPPRVRRRRADSPPPAPAPPAPTALRAAAAPPAPPPPPPPPPAAASRKSTTNKPRDSRKSSTRSDADQAAPPKAKPGRPPGKTKTPVRKSIKPEPTSALQSTRKSVAHRGVPVPEKMKKIIEKLKK